MHKKLLRQDLNHVKLLRQKLNILRDLFINIFRIVVAPPAYSLHKCELMNILAPATLLVAGKGWD